MYVHVCVRVRSTQCSIAHACAYIYTKIEQIEDVFIKRRIMYRCSLFLIHRFTQARIFIPYFSVFCTRDLSVLSVVDTWSLSSFFGRFTCSIFNCATMKITSPRPLTALITSSMKLIMITRGIDVARRCTLRSNQCKGI